MIKNYLKIAWRNLMKDKTFTLLNVVGLSVAFGVAILLSMAAFFSLSYDRFHENGDRIYQVYASQQTPKGPEAATSQAAPFAEALRLEVPGVDKITRFLEREALTIYREKEINLDAVWLDDDFFEMFTFPILKGNENNPLKELSSVVVTDSLPPELIWGGDSAECTATGQEVTCTLTSLAPGASYDLLIGFNMTDTVTDGQTIDNSAWGNNFDMSLAQAVAEEKAANINLFLPIPNKRLFKSLKKRILT